MAAELSSYTAVAKATATSSITEISSITSESLFAKHASLISALKRKYQQDAVIQRLFYDLPISLEESYVNLAIVTEKEQQEKAKAALAAETDQVKKETHLLRDERLKTFESLYGSKENIELKDIFASVPSQKKAVKQVLLLGTAGIGKSTACQKLCNEWAKEVLWKDKIVFWIKLRAIQAADNVATLIHRECFLRKDAREIQVKEIEEILNALPTSILFVLDGYDERKEADKVIIEELLEYPHWLLTSRPYGYQGIRYERKLETIGFTEKNIDEYAHKFFSSLERPPSFSQALIHLIKVNPNLKGIAPIPINLELICSMFERRLQSHEPAAFQQVKFTLTSLYEDLIQDLQERVLLKPHAEQPVNRQTMAEAVAFLEKLALWPCKRQHC